MLQKLRIKFIALTMGVLFLVLALIIGTVNLLNYRHVLASADRTLEILLSNGGRFPERPFPGKGPFAPEMSPELPFETRFFTVRLNAEGEVVSADLGKIAAVSAETAADYAGRIAEAGESRGFVDAYRFAAQRDSGETMIVFMDCGRALSSAKSFLRNSVGISLAAFFAVSLMLYVLSARIVKPIAESYEKQRQFITNASHDLKTPITIIDADLDVLEMECGENEWLRDIGKQTRRLAELIQELVFLSRMEEKENSFQRMDFPFSDVVSETAQSFEALAIAQGKALSIWVQPMLSYCGDERALRQLVTILMDNALKYSSDRGEIGLRLERTDRGALRLSVYNTCAPIGAEDMRHLFDRFYRGDKSRNAQTGGYGIGLSIARAIVQAHRGEIRCKSEDGHSLTVTAVFPVK